VEDLWDMDYKPKVNRSYYSCNIADGVRIYDHDKDHIFNDMTVRYRLKWSNKKIDPAPKVDPTPTEWKEKLGFRMDLSYSQGVSLFKKLGFSVEEKDGRLGPDFKIVGSSPDKSLVVELNFAYTGNLEKDKRKDIGTSVLLDMDIKSKSGNSIGNATSKEVNAKSNIGGSTSQSAAPATSGQTLQQQGTREDGFIGMRFKGYDDHRAYTDKHGFWSAWKNFYGDDKNKFVIEVWQNEKVKKESIVLDRMIFPIKELGKIGPFEIYNTKTDESSSYAMVQFDGDNNVLKIFDVDLKKGKITVKNLGPDWKAKTEWDSY
jgi:hypothetical protein